jgi:hypothetical protein
MGWPPQGTIGPVGLVLPDVHDQPIFARRDDPPGLRHSPGRRLARQSTESDRLGCERSGPAPGDRRDVEERSMRGKQLVLRALAVLIALTAALVS